jgi:hypothetical protein
MLALASVVTLWAQKLLDDRHAEEIQKSEAKGSYNGGSEAKSREA